MISHEEILVQQINILRQKNKEYEEEQKKIQLQAVFGKENLQIFIDGLGKVDKHYQDEESTDGSEGESDLDDVRENFDDGATYWERLRKEFELGRHPFLDANILKNLSFELKGRERVVAIMYYISWACAVKWRGIVSHVKELWKDFKHLVDKLMNWLK